MLFFLINLIHKHLYLIVFYYHLYVIYKNLKKNHNYFYYYMDLNVIFGCLLLLLHTYIIILSFCQVLCLFFIVMRHNHLLVCSYEGRCLIIIRISLFGLVIIFLFGIFDPLDLFAFGDELIDFGCFFEVDIAVVIVIESEPSWILVLTLVSIS